MYYVNENGEIVESTAADETAAIDQKADQTLESGDSGDESGVFAEGTAADATDPVESTGNDISGDFLGYAYLVEPEATQEVTEPELELLMDVPAAYAAAALDGDYEGYYLTVDGVRYLFSPDVKDDLFVSGDQIVNLGTSTVYGFNVDNYVGTWDSLNVLQVAPVASSNAGSTLYQYNSLVSRLYWTRNTNGTSVNRQTEYLTGYTVSAEEFVGDYVGDHEFRASVIGIGILLVILTLIWVSNIKRRLI